MFEFLPFIILISVAAILGIVLVFSRFFAAIGGKILQMIQPFRNGPEGKDRNSKGEK